MFFINRITRGDIVGAKITDIYSASRQLEDCTCTAVYFTVDRGFSFMLPYPGTEWAPMEIATGAVPLSEKSTDASASVKKGFFGTSWFQGAALPVTRSAAEDWVKRIKNLAIAGVYCPKMNESLGFYEPDDASLIFEDGSQAYCRTVAPKGVPTGLIYRTDVGALPKVVDMVDFFDLPVKD